MLEPTLGNFFELYPALFAHSAYHSSSDDLGVKYDEMKVANTILRLLSASALARPKVLNPYSSFASTSDL